MMRKLVNTMADGTPVYWDGRHFGFGCTPLPIMPRPDELAFTTGTEPGGFPARNRREIDMAGFTSGAVEATPRDPRERELRPEQPRLMVADDFPAESAMTHALVMMDGDELTRFIEGSQLGGIREEIARSGSVAEEHRRRAEQADKMGAVLRSACESASQTGYPQTSGATRP